MYKYYEEHWMRYFMCCDLKNVYREYTVIKSVKNYKVLVITHL